MTALTTLTAGSKTRKTFDEWTTVQAMTGLQSSQTPRSYHVPPPATAVLKMSIWICVMGKYKGPKQLPGDSNFSPAQ